MKRHIERRVWASFVFAILFLLVVLFFMPGFGQYNIDIDGKRESFISLKSKIQADMLSSGNYKCCLEKPCTYCIEKTPGHGEGASCECLEDIVNGEHPCGECIGEILEGHGNKYVAEYFARAIADELGEEHIGTLRKIVEEKYGLPVNKQH